MQPEAPKLLEDIRAAAAYVLDKTGGKTLDQYLAGGWHAQAEGAGMGPRTCRKAWPRWRLAMAPSTATLLTDSKLTEH